MITKVCKNCAGGKPFSGQNLCGRNMKQCNIEETLVNFLTVAQFLKVYRLKKFFSVSADFYLISVVAENMGNFLKANFLGVLKVRESRGGLWWWGALV